MKQQYAAYQVVPYQKMRRLEALAYRSVQHKPMIHGLIEVDVTRALDRLREHKATTGESLSFTSFLTACLAKAVDERLKELIESGYGLDDSTVESEQAGAPA